MVLSWGRFSGAWAGGVGWRLRPGTLGGDPAGPASPGVGRMSGGCGWDRVRRSGDGGPVLCRFAWGLAAGRRAARPDAWRLGLSILGAGGLAWAGSMRPGRFGSGRAGLGRFGLGWASGVRAEIVKCLTRTKEARWASAFDRVGGWRGGGRCTGSRWGIPCKAFSQITPLTTPRNKKPSPRPTRCATIKPDRG